MDKEEWIDVSRPSKSYVGFLGFAEILEEPKADLPQLFGAVNPSGLSFWPDPVSALEALIEAHQSEHFPNKKGAHIAYMGPYCAELEGLKNRNANLDFTNLGNDPEHYLEVDPKSFDLLFLFSPHPSDSAFFTPEFLARISKHFLQNPKLRIVIDETLSSLYWESKDEVGLLRYVEEPRVSIFYSMLPWTAHSIGLSLILRGPRGLTGLKTTDPQIQAWKIFLQLWLREFHRGEQHLRLRSALSRSARTIMETLRARVDAKKILCRHWPRAGHSLLLEFPGQNPVELSQKLEEQLLRIPLLFANPSAKAPSGHIVIPVSLKTAKTLADRILKIEL
jgi:hypothetical protein